ncbi:MAG: polysaccharide deacetylase family protein [Anaerolineales bacterium]|nr:polysaccharide deacetylase family protein [Anaerolineales bacterium]
MYLNNNSANCTWRSLARNKLLNFAYQFGLERAGRFIFKNYLTVLNYHRIDDPNRHGFDSFKPNVSARREDFAQQMDYLMRWFKVVSIQEIVRWLDGKSILPSHAALITFDDGYADNFLNAYPILKERNLPAVVFLTSGHIQNDAPFYWDLVAYCFYHTPQDTIIFPDGHQEHWNNKTEKDRVSSNLIEKLKILPDDEKTAWIARLPELLNVSIQKGYFKSLMMNWDQIREMNKNGIDFGGHTINHPILTRVSLRRAEDEIAGSRTRIEDELGKPILGFAYPNGGKADFNQEIEHLTANSGYRVAFTLLNGPTSFGEAMQNPYAIRRVFISHKHTLAQFSFLVNGFNRYRPS